MIDTFVPVAEYRKRREKVLRAIKGATGIVLAGEGSSPLVGSWHPDWDFYYLTGIADEPGAAIVFDPSNEWPDRRITLLLRPLNPELERWDGLRESLGEKVKADTGFKTVHRTLALPRILTASASRNKRLACLHPFAAYNAPVSKDLEMFRRVAERIPGASIEDRTEVLPKLRHVKSTVEVKLIQRAVDATAEGFDALCGALGDGVNEKDLERAMTRGFADAGGTGIGYNPIVGAGRNTCVLHYKNNDQPVGKGDLVLVDAGASVGNYTADVTRTYPVSGAFTPRQAEIYTLVLRALDAGIRAAKPGATMGAVDRAARDMIEKAGHADHFYHGIGHPLGLEVHDSDPGGKLEPGNVITIEPGIYIEDENLGVRLEDDVLITAKGSRVLTRAIPKKIADVEAQIKAARKRRRRASR